MDRFDLDELELVEAEHADSASAAGGGGRAVGGIEAAGRANVDLRMETLPPGQSCQPHTARSTPHTYLT